MFQKKTTIIIWTVWFIALAYFYYQIYVLTPHPHFFPAFFLVGTMLGGAVCVYGVGFKRLFFGPKRFVAVLWMLLATVPIAGLGLMTFEAFRFVNTTRDEPHHWNHLIAAPPVLAAGDAWIRLTYPHRFEGEKIVLFYTEEDDPEKLVAEIDRYITELENRLETRLVEKPYWIRGKLFGFSGLAISGVALCGNMHWLPPDDYHGIRYLDYHEIAHTIITQAMSLTKCSPQMPPVILVEGWAEAHSVDPKTNAIATLGLEMVEKVPFRELVTPAAYYRNDYRSYKQGATIVNYLLSHYGYPKFLELYSRANETNFEQVFHEIYGLGFEEFDSLYLEEAEKVAKDEIVYGFHPLPKSFWAEEEKQPAEVEPSDFTDEQKSLLEEMKSAHEKLNEYYNTDILFSQTNTSQDTETDESLTFEMNFAASDSQHRRYEYLYRRTDKSGESDISSHGILILDSQAVWQYSLVDRDNPDAGFQLSGAIMVRQDKENEYVLNSATPVVLNLDPNECKIHDLTAFEENGERLVRLEYSNVFVPNMNNHVVYELYRDRLWSVKSLTAERSGIGESAGDSVSTKVDCTYDTEHPQHLTGSKKITKRTDNGKTTTYNEEMKITKFVKGSPNESELAPPAKIVKIAELDSRDLYPTDWFPTYFYVSLVAYCLIFFFPSGNCRNEREKDQSTGS